MKRTRSGPKSTSQQKRHIHVKHSKESVSDTEALQSKYKKYLGRARQLVADQSEKHGKQKPAENPTDVNDNLSVDYAMQPLHHSTPIRNVTTVRDRTMSDVQDSQNIVDAGVERKEYNRSNTVLEKLRSNYCMETIYKKGDKLIKQNIIVNQEQVPDVNSNITIPQPCTCSIHTYCLKHSETVPLLCGKYMLK